MIAFTGPNGSRLPCTQYGVSFLSEPLAEEVELAGYMKLGLWVSSSSADMDIFAALRVLDENGQEVFYNTPPSAPSPITLGFLKVSHRKLDEKRSSFFQPFHTHSKADYQPLAANEKVQVEVELWNNTAVVKKGHRIWLTIQPHDGCFVYAKSYHEYDAGYHTARGTRSTPAASSPRISRSRSFLRRTEPANLRRATRMPPRGLTA